MDERHALGDLLTRLRSQAGLSQEELASAAGVDVRTIGDLERYRTIYPRTTTAYRIADVLGLTGAERENWLSLALPPAGVAVTYEPEVAITEDFAATTLAEAVSELRQRRGISARELSQRADVHARTIADIETGRRRTVHRRNAFKLADELGLDGDARERFLRLAAGETIGEPARSPTLVGRKRESADVTDLLLSRRLVVLTGPGGIGKTALAEAVLADLDRKHLELDLTSVSAGDDLAHAITLVCRLDEGGDWVEQLGTQLPPDGVLLLDNLEHLQGVREAVETILTSRGDVTVLATSRTTGGLDAEAEYALGPLPVTAACQVFRDVARRSGRPLSARVPATLVEQVCVRLDLLPLTITLAATWSRLMTPQDILARIDRPADILRVPERPGREAHSRHSAVASTVGWSLGLVSEPARALFRALSAYPAPWPLDLVEAVCPGGRLDPLHQLVEAGLVTAADNEVGGTSYTMLQTVRDVGNSELSAEPDWHGEVLTRHAAHLLERARSLYPKLFTAERPDAIAECDLLAPHVQGAFEYLIRSADWRAVSLAAVWWQYWFQRGHYHRGLAMVSRALEASSGAPAKDLAAALYAAAGLAHYGGDNRQAAGYAKQALDQARAAGDMDRVGSVISLIGMMEFYGGHPEAAREWYERGLAEIDDGSEPRTYATLLTNAAPVYAALGELEAAREAAEEAARRCRALDNPAGIATNLASLAEWAARTGDRDRARELLAECRELQEILQDSYNTIQCRFSLGKLAADEGDAATAQEELDAARQLMRGTEDPWCDAFADALAAQIAVLNGDMSAAHSLARSALRAGEQLKYQPAMVAAALADAAAAAWQGEREGTLEAARTGFSESEQADEAAVVSFALLVVAVHLDRTSLISEDVLALERLVRQWASVPGAAPYTIAVRSARRRGLKLVPAEGDAPPIKELRQLALTLCGQ